MLVMCCSEEIDGLWGSTETNPLATFRGGSSPATAARRGFAGEYPPIPPRPSPRTHGCRLPFPLPFPILVRRSWSLLSDSSDSTTGAASSSSVCIRTLEPSDCWSPCFIRSNRPLALVGTASAVTSANHSQHLLPDVSKCSYTAFSYEDDSLWSISSIITGWRQSAGCVLDSQCCKLQGNSALTLVISKRDKEVQETNGPLDPGSRSGLMRPVQTPYFE
mmetsp:Transcript_56458/g.123707  ORF Transcript_56458/g.123707 Transcript_56458/m.123707 type:complete len:219 (-) Transcript_56458:1085-1741(-)